MDGLPQRRPSILLLQFCLFTAEHFYMTLLLRFRYNFQPLLYFFGLLTSFSHDIGMDHFSRIGIIFSKKVRGSCRSGPDRRQTHVLDHPARIDGLHV